MVDKKIISLFKNSNLNNFRSVMVLIGENSKNQIPVTLNLLSKNSYKPVNSIIWCYKNDPQESEESEEKMKDFYRSKDIQFINYTETEKILGQTVDLLILQDFENLTPNLIALSVETVRGGGLVILLFDKNENLDSIVNTRSELICGEYVPRYNRRLFRSLIKSNFTIFCDSNLKVLPINEIKENNTSENAEKSPVEVNEVPGTEGTLINLGKTQDQKNVLNLLFEAVKDRTERVIYSIQAGRGRGKSVSLGLAISRAIDLKYSSIYVTSPALENVKMVFEFVIKGLESIGYKKYVDFKIVYQFKGKKRLIQRIEFSKGFKQTIEYFNPFDELKYHPDMFIIDEAAAIPLPVLKRLLFPNLIIMATTVSGYEGTGRSFSTKLSEYLKNQDHDENDHENPFNYKEIFMNKSIRYGDNDPVEKWLNKTLLLDVEVKPLTKCPIPSGCDLFYVSRDLLFSGSKASEVILRDVFGLFISSHYKNSPNDIQILSDSPNHEIFTLLTTVNDLPRVLCAIHVSFEGRCRGDLLKKGNLIPWIVSETYFNTEILDNLGIRIVRIAVHPDYMSMGYGSRALDLLFDFFKTKQNNSLTSLIYKGGDVLFNELNDVMIPKISWIGTSFGVTNKLLNFWKKHSLLPICIKQKVSFVTGEHTLILLKATDDLLEKSIRQYYSYFKKRFIGQLAYSFRDLEPSLCLTLLFNKIENKMDLESIKLSGNDLDRLERYSRNTTDSYQVIDLLPLVSRMYFYGLLEVKLTLLQQSVLMMIGLQCHKIEEVAKFNSLNDFEINSILMKILSSLLPKLK